MRTLILTALVAGALPVGAQTPEIGPDSSVLFAPSAGGDSTIAPSVRARGGRGAVIGALVGGGIALAGRVKDGDGGVCNASLPPQCREALNYGLGSVAFAAISGAAVGYLVDRSLAPRRALTPVPRSSSLFITMDERVSLEGDTTAIAPPTGFQNAVSLFGGAAAGLGAYAFLSQDFRGACPDSPDVACPANRVPVGWRIVGAAASGTAGYLLTRGMTGVWSKPRATPRQETFTPREETGLSWWQGGVLGAGVGAITTSFFAFGLHAGDELELTDGQTAVVFAPLGALIGFVVGGSHAQGR